MAVELSQGHRKGVRVFQLFADDVNSDKEVE